MKVVNYCFSCFKDLLSDYTIASAEETTLGANQWMANSSRFSWRTVDRHHDNQDVNNNNSKKKKKKKSTQPRDDGGKAISVSMEAMQVKTFIISLMSVN